MVLTRAKLLSLRYSSLRLPHICYEVVRELQLASKLTRHGLRGGWQAKRAKSAFKFLTFGLANVRSVNSRSEDILDFLCSTRVDVLSLTETWLNSDDGDEVLRAVCPPGYTALRNPCTGGPWWRSGSSPSYLCPGVA